MSARSNKSIDAPKSGAAPPPIQATADRFSAVLRVGQMQDLKQRLAASRSVAAAGLTELSDLTEDVGPDSSKRGFEGGQLPYGKIGKVAPAFENVNLLSYSPDTIKKWYPSATKLSIQQHSLRALDVWFKYLRVYTMGEAAKFDIPDAKRYGDSGTKSITLTSKIGPFKGASITLTGNATSILYTYTETVLSPMLQYLDHAHIVYHSYATNACYLHGGFGNMVPAEYAKAFINSYQNAHYNTTKLSDVKKEMWLDDFHMLGMNGISPITGKLDLANNGNQEMAKGNMHYSASITVVGHTPQSQGIPTIIRVNDDGYPTDTQKDRFLIQLDTQRTDRVHNTHCLAINAEGKFKLRGTFKPKGDTIVYGYEAMCSDPAIGIFIDGSSHKIGGTKPYLRCVGRVTSPEKQVGKYIWVSYHSTTANPFAGETRILGKDEVYHMVTFQTDEDRLQNPFNNTPQGMELVCGDVEASVPFLNGFMSRAMEIMDLHDHMPNAEAYAKAARLKRLGCNIASIGDVIGDPTGLSMYGGSISDEAYCIEFMVQYADWKLCGNRDINKLRLFHEIHAFMNSEAPDDLMELLRIYDLDPQSAYVQLDGALIQSWPSIYAGTIRDILGRKATPEGKHMKQIKKPAIDIPLPSD